MIERHARLAGLTSLMLVVGGCTAGTGGDLVTVSMEVRQVGARRFTLENAREVELTSVRVSLGPLYGFERPVPTAAQGIFRLSGFLQGVAHAHGDDFFAGGLVVTEWLEPRVLEPTAAPARLGSMPALAGPLRSATLHLLPHAELGGEGLVVEGTVREAGGQAARSFSMGVTLPGSFEDRRVDFIAGDGELVEGGTVTLEVEPATWFSGVKLDETELTPVPTDGQSARAVSINLRRAVSWRVRASP